MPSAIPLAGHSTPGLLAVSSLPRFGSTAAGRQLGQYTPGKELGYIDNSNVPGDVDVSNVRQYMPSTWYVVLGYCTSDDATIVTGQELLEGK